MPLISLASGILPDCDGPTTAKAAVDAGYRAVGLTVDPTVWTDATTREVQRIVGNAGIEVLDVEVVIIQPGRERSPESDRIIEVGAELGAPNVLIVSNDPDLDNTKRAFEHLCERASAASMRATLEFMMIFELNSLAAALEVVRDTGHPAGAILIDALHLYRCGDSHGDLERLDPHLFPYMQLCDGPRDVAAATPEGYLADALDARLAPGEDGVHVVQRPEAHGVAGFQGGAADVGQQKDVRQIPVSRMDVRLVVVDVEAGCRQLSRSQGRDQIFVIH